MKPDRMGSYLLSAALVLAACTEAPKPTPTPRSVPKTPISSTPTSSDPKGLEAVALPPYSLVPETVVPEGWDFHDSKYLFYKILIPQDLTLVPLSSFTSRIVAEEFLGESVEGDKNRLKISAWPAQRPVNNSEWLPSLEDRIREKSRMVDYFHNNSLSKKEEFITKDYWPKPMAGSKAWFIEIRNPYKKSVYTEVVFIKSGRLWTITYACRYQGYEEGYIKEKNRFEFMTDSFKTP